MMALSPSAARAAHPFGRPGIGSRRPARNARFARSAAGRPVVATIKAVGALIALTGSACGRHPWGLACEDRIGVDEQLSGAGDKGHSMGLAAGLEALIERDQSRIPTECC